MTPKVMLRHTVSSRAGRVDEFPIAGSRTITLGRDPGCDVVFDPDRDDLVSRTHSKIFVEPGPVPSALLSDLGSRNGTFVNRQRVRSGVRLMPGDLVQLGPGGPEFIFDIEPREEEGARATRLAGSATVAAPAAPPPAAGLGRATVERLIDSRTRRSHRRLWIGTALALLVAVAVGGGLAVMRWRERGLSPTEVAAANLDAVVYLEVSWKLVDIESGMPLNQVYIPNQTRDEQGRERAIVPGGPAFLPVFVALGQQIEPMLSTDAGGGKYHAIGGPHTGSGFLVSPDGFLLTNRHVAATWFTRYQFRDPAGVVLQLDEQQKVRQMIPVGADRFPPWVPANAQFLIQGTFDPANFRFLSRPLAGKALEGRNDYLDVTLARNRTRVPGKLARVSDTIDLAMVKIDLPRPLRPAELFDNYDTARVGDAVTVMGYPGISPAVVGAVQSQDYFNRTPDRKIIPDPTTSVGNIGRIIRSQEGVGETAYSFMGDVYQLTVNSTGGGNSGGPVFDAAGRVIGVYTSGNPTISFAVPIKYGIELMGTRRVM